MWKKAKRIPGLQTKKEKKKRDRQESRKRKFSDRWFDEDMDIKRKKTWNKMKKGVDISTPLLYSVHTF